MEAFLAYESDASYIWEDDEALFTLTLPYVRLNSLNTGSSSSSSGDDNDVEISSDLETSSDIEVIESTAAAAVPLAKVGSQRDLLPFQVHETPQGLHGRGGTTNKKSKRCQRCQRRQIYRGDSVKQEIGRVHITSLRNVTIFF